MNYNKQTKKLYNDKYIETMFTPQIYSLMNSYRVNVPGHTSQGMPMIQNYEDLWSPFCALSPSHLIPLS